MKKYFRDYVYLVLISGFIIIVDQWTKSIVRTNLAYGETWTPWAWLAPYARIVHWSNTGAAFGMFQDFGGVFAVLAVVVALGILLFYPQIPHSQWPLRLALGMQLGGALGNLIDRLKFGGSVTDFISVGSFPVFNIADASISLGVAMLVLGMWYLERKEKKTSPEDPAEPSNDEAGNIPELDANFRE